MHCYILLHSIALHCILLYCILCFIVLHCCMIVFTYKMMRNAIISSFTVHVCMSLRDYIFHMGWLIRNKITPSLEWPVLSMLMTMIILASLCLTQLLSTSGGTVSTHWAVFKFYNCSSSHVMAARYMAFIWHCAHVLQGIHDIISLTQ